jgi:hypothetical protein
MEIKCVADRCLKIIAEEGNRKNWYGPPHLGKAHTINLLENIKSGATTGEQAHRHLGWAQAAMYRIGLRSLEDLKAINKSDGK